MQSSRYHLKDRSFEFALRIVRVAQFLDERPGTARTLGRQLLRAGTSVGANLSEAQSAQSRADFIHKHEIALKEARETAYWLELIKGAGIMPAERLTALQDETQQIIKMLVATVMSCKGRRGPAREPSSDL